jgi:hypothetical protein
MLTRVWPVQNVLLQTMKRLNHACETKFGIVTAHVRNRQTGTGAWSIWEICRKATAVD